MSAAHDETAHHGHDDHGAAGHGSMRDYVIGFVLSVILTAIPFWLVMGDVIADKSLAAIIIVAFAAVQVVVHMVYFLHMNSKSEGGWTMMALLFTIMVVVICLAGVLWVMFHLATNMMPIHDMSNMGMG
ncbi:MAG: cytochrome o ubiquinol oxidase subunit IV [Sphingobium sp.]|nr:cytochrome o ubiquinol oxidase subunit IV [Sphingobium sp.]